MCSSHTSEASALLTRAAGDNGRMDGPGLTAALALAGLGSHRVFLPMHLEVRGKGCWSTCVISTPALTGCYVHMDAEAPLHITVSAPTPGHYFFSKTKGISKHRPPSIHPPAKSEERTKRHTIRVRSDRPGNFTGATTKALLSDRSFREEAAP